MIDSEPLPPLENELALPRTPLARNPLVWALLLEIVVAGALVGVAWHIVSTRHLTAPALVSQLPFAAPTPSPLPSIAIPTGRSQHSAARLRHDPGFVRGQLSRLNQEQSVWERAQWAIVQAVTSAARSYLDHVVVPAVEHARASP